jgi:hypothetical protein
VRRFSRPLITVLIAAFAAHFTFAQNSSPAAPTMIQDDDPQAVLWQDVERNLQGPDADNYFETTLKDALLGGGANGVPPVKGTVVSSKPTDHPSEVVVALPDRTLEVTLKLVDDRGREGYFSNPLLPGMKVAFAGVVEAFTMTPFMLIFEVELDSPADDSFVVSLAEPGTPNAMPSVSVNRPSGAADRFVDMSLDGLPQHAFSVNDHGVVTEHRGILLDRWLSSFSWRGLLESRRSRYVIEVDGIQTGYTLSAIEAGSLDKREWLVADETSPGGQRKAALIVVGADGTLIQRIGRIQRILIHEQ